MQKVWRKIEAYLGTHNAELLADLNPPATDAEIHELEFFIGTTLPVDFVASLKIHNGQKGKADGLFDDYEFLSVARILDAWLFWKKIYDSSRFNDGEVQPGIGVKSDWWNLKWVPFAYNGCGDYLCLDLAPASSGVRGQVITVWHDDGARKSKANSFSTWLDEYI